MDPFSKKWRRYVTMETYPFNLKLRNEGKPFVKMMLRYALHNQIQQRHGTVKKSHTNCMRCGIDGCHTIAHVGLSVKQVVHKIVEQHYPEKSLLELYNLCVLEHNASCRFVIACAPCNAKLEQEPDGRGADESAQTQQALVIVPRRPVEDLLSVGVNDQRDSLDENPLQATMLRRHVAQDGRIQLFVLDIRLEGQIFTR